MTADVPAAAIARFVADYWRRHLVEQSRKLHAAGSHEAATGTGIGAHALCMVLAALDGETDPDQLPAHLDRPRQVRRTPQTVVELMTDDCIHGLGPVAACVICNGRAKREAYLQHRKHLRWKLVPYLRVKRWLLDRCEDCGKRFQWREARFGTGWDAPGVLHDSCHQVRHLRGHVVDLARYARGEADDTGRWRVEHTWLGDVNEYWRKLGVGARGRA